MDENRFENPLYRNVQSILRSYGERLLRAGYSILRADDEKVELLHRLLSQHKLTEGEIGTPYELDGYYLTEGGRVTEKMYIQMIREFEEEVRKREKLLMRKAKIRDGGKSKSDDLVEQYIAVVKRIKLSKPTLDDLSKGMSVHRNIWQRFLSNPLFLGELRKKVKGQLSYKFSKKEEKKNFWMQVLIGVDERIDIALRKKDALSKKTTRYKDERPSDGAYADWGEAMSEEVGKHKFDAKKKRTPKHPDEQSTEE